MIPYHQIGPWHLGPLPIYPFGLLVGTAILLGTYIAQRRAEHMGIHPKLYSEALIWLFIGGFVTAHIVSVVFYFPERVRDNPLELLMFWRGISSFGGFIGGAVGLILYIKKYHLPMWTTLDATAYALVPAWILGRMGCTVAFDHPGKPTNFFLGFSNPPYPVPAGYHGIYNLGFLEMLFTVVLAITVYFTTRKKRFDGFILALIALSYAPVRFMLDSLRIVDAKYLGLTPGQYFSILLFALGIWIAYTRMKAAPEAFEHFDFKTGKGGYLVASSTSTSAAGGKGSKHNQSSSKHSQSKKKHKK
ncbi:MAG: prolipoprotein diacylglyceryl transferase [Deltaproteobacteria bacterium]|nr:prolipoprotein diacylglyceryl transferase [Deltaproteobacteria bacterium]